MCLDAGGSAHEVITVPNKRNSGDQFQIKVDHSFNNNQKTSIYYYFDDDNTLDPFAKFQAEGAPLGNFPGRLRNAHAADKRSSHIDNRLDLRQRSSASLSSAKGR